MAIVMKDHIAARLESSPRAINERLMTARIPLQHDRFLTVISAYAPTMTNPEANKEEFYATLDRAICDTPAADKLMILSDFNARVGQESYLWPEQLGKHGIGKCNSNGLLLLSKCTEHALTITNTWFQSKTVHKTTWMHPRSKHWH